MRLSKRLVKRFGVLLVIGLIGIALAMPVYADHDFRYGDANRDGDVNVGDAILVLRYIVGLETLDGPGWHAADVNGDNDVNVGDAIAILRWIVGLIDQFPAEEALKEAEDAVALAESTKQQDDVDSARTLVEALPPIPPKDDLNARLDAVQAAIDEDTAKTEAIAAAIAAIDALPAPGDLTMDDKAAVEAARDLVNTAKGLGATDDDITNLDKLVTAEETIAALEAATDAVVIAEASEAQADVNTARPLVEALTDGAAKSDLIDRLDAVQAAIDKQAAIDAAIVAIAGLPASGDLTLAHAGAVEDARALVKVAIDDHGAAETDITNLDKLVTAEETIAALEAATDAVVTAEASEAQADVNTARPLVEALTDGAAKSDLIDRLDAVQAAIDKQAAIAAAIDAIAALPAPGDLTLDDAAAVAAARELVDIARDDYGAVKADITNLAKLVTAEETIAALEAATDAVLTAEASGEQIDVFVARALVGMLPDGAAKSDLIDRLDAVQAAIDKQAAIAAAIDAIAALPAPGDLTLDHETAVAAARALVDTAQGLGATDDDITNLGELEAAESTLLDLKAATTAVLAAEASGTQADVNTARPLVEALTDGSAKSDLSARLDAVQTAIDEDTAKAEAIAAAVSAIAALPAPGDLTLDDAADVAAARELVEIARDDYGAVKADITNLAKLVTAEETIAALEAATDAVLTAEASGEQTDVFVARALVGLLPDGAAKSALNDRLDAVQAIIDGDTAKDEAIAAAIAAIDALPAPGDLTMDDKAVVEVARDLVNTAKGLGATDDDITNLDKLVTAEETIAALEAATEAVETAETSKTQADVNTARALVEALPEGAARSALNARLDAVQAAIDEDTAKAEAIAAAISAIAALPAPGDLTLAHATDVAAARELVEIARDDHGAVKADITNLDKLEEAEEVIAALELATAYVAAAETSGEQTDVFVARALVSLLPDGSAKSALNDRLDAVQAAIDKQAAITAAIDAIAALPTPGDLTLDHEAAVAAARALVDTAQGLGATDDDINNLGELEAAESTLCDLEAATTAVETAEVGEEQADLDAARGLVAALPEGGARDALDARLDTLQEIIDARVAREVAIDAAIAAIDALPAPGDLTLDHEAAVVAARALVDTAQGLGATDDDITNLDELEAAESTILALEAATNAVEAAEASEEQADLDAARDLVAALPEGGAKDALDARLDDLQEIIDARVAREAAIDAAIAAIAALPDMDQITLDDGDEVAAARGKVDAAFALGATPDDITNLGDLEALEAMLPALQEATAAVVAAEASMIRDDANYAFGLAFDLPDCMAKVDLFHRLDVLITAIEKQTAIDEAIAAIEALPALGELTLADKEDVEDARQLVKDAQLIHGATDDDITNLAKLVTAEETIAALATATAAVEMCEAVRVQGNVDFARSLVGQLPDGGAKDELNSRIDAVESSIPVALAVALAEEGDKGVGEEFALLLTIVNKHGEAIPYPQAPGLTVITSNLDGELFSQEIAYDGAAGEATAMLSLQTRGLHLITVTVAGLSETISVTVPQTFSDYAMTIEGPDELEVGQIGSLSLRAWAEEPFGDSSLTATCEYEVVGGGYGLFEGVGLFGLSSWFELTPDYDETTALMFIPQDAATYEIRATLRAVNDEVLATATCTVKAGVAVSAVAAIDAIDADYGTPLDEVGLPEQVEVTLADSSAYTADLAWDAGTPAYNESEPGTYHFTGTLVLGEGAINPGNLTAAVNVNVADPVPSTYGFSYEVPESILENEEIEIPVTFATVDENDVGYDAVRFVFGATGPGDVTFKATDSEGVEYTFTNAGVWGPSAGFALPASFTSTNDWTFNFAANGDYTITFKLIDLDTGDTVAQGVQEVTVLGISEYGFEVPDEIVVVAGDLLEGRSIPSEDGQMLGDLAVADLTPVKVTLKATGIKDLGYDKVRILPLAVTGPEGGALQAWLYASVQDKKWYDTVVTGWGSKGTGFKLDPDEASEMDVYLFADKAGTYELTFQAVDTSKDDEPVIATGTATVTVQSRSEYAFEYEVPELLVAGEDAVIPVTTKATVVNEHGYDRVRFAIKAEGDGDVTFKITAHDTGKEHSFVNEGYWGPADGFALPADFASTNDWTLNFSAAGDYAITFRLVDLVTGKDIIKDTVSGTVKARSGYGFEVPDEIVVVAGDLLEGRSIPSEDGQMLGDLAVADLTPVKVTLKATGIKDLGYDKVRILPLAVTGPEGGALQAWLYASVQDKKWYDTVVTGWGSKGTGFKLDPDEASEMDVYLFADKAGTYNLTFKAVDTSKDDEPVIATGTATVTVQSRSEYAFEYEVPELLVAGEDAVIPVTTKATVVNEHGYDRVRFAIKAEGDGDVTFKITAHDTGKEHSFVNEGYWGPADGFALPADFASTNDWTLNFSAAGDYAITFRLVDLVTGKDIIKDTVSGTVKARSGYGFEVPDEIVVVAGDLLEGRSIPSEDGQMLGDLAVADLTPVKVTLKATGIKDLGYDKVRILPLAVTGPEGGALQAWLYASVQDKKWYDTVVTGWGSKGTGFKLDPDEASEMDVYLFADKAGTYELTFQAVDTSKDDEPVIATGTATVTVQSRSTYKFSYELPDEAIIAGEPVEVPVTTGYDVLGDVGYERVLIKFAGESDDGAPVTFKITEHGTGTEYEFEGSGSWGPSEGWPLPADFSSENTWTLVFPEAGDYTIEFWLEDLDADAVIVGAEEEVEVKSRSTYKFSYELPDEAIIAGEPVEVPVTTGYDVLGDVGYERVLIKFAGESDDGAPVTFKITEHGTGTEYEFEGSGSWGPSEGWPLPADFSSENTWTLVFPEAGDYTIEFWLEDLDADAVIVGAEEEVEVKSRSTYGFEVPDEIVVVAGDLLEGHSIPSEDGQTLGDLAVADLTPVKVTLKATGIKDLGYDKVRILPLAVTGPEGGALQAWLYASVQDKKWYDTVVTGWGSKGTGFKLDPDEASEMDVYLFADKAGTYNLTFKAVDTSKDDEPVIATGTATVTVVLPPISVSYSASDVTVVEAPEGFHSDYAAGDILYKVAITADFGDEEAVAAAQASGRSVLTEVEYDTDDVTTYVYDETGQRWIKNTKTWGPDSGYPLSLGNFAGSTDVYFAAADGVDEVNFTVKLLDVAVGWEEVVYGSGEFDRILPIEDAALAKAIKDLEDAALALPGKVADAESSTEAQGYIDDVQALLDAVKLLDPDYDASEWEGIISEQQAIVNAMMLFENAIESLEGIVDSLKGDGTDSQSIISLAWSNHDLIVGMLHTLPDCRVKEIVVERLNEAKEKIDLAQAALDAVNATVAAEEAAGALKGDGTDEQEAISEAQDRHDAALELVLALPDGDLKAALVSRLAAVQALIDAAIEVSAARAAVEALFVDAGAAELELAAGVDQAAIDAASALVEALADGAGKDDLAALIEEAQTLLDEINGRLEISYIHFPNSVYNKQVYLMGYAIGINVNENGKLKSQHEGLDKGGIDDTSSLVVSAYKDGVLLGEQSFKNYKPDDPRAASRTCGTLDVFGSYVSSSWDSTWHGELTDIPDKIVATVEYWDGHVVSKEIDFALSGTSGTSAAPGTDDNTNAIFVEALNRTETAEDMRAAIIVLEEILGESTYSDLDESEQLAVAEAVLADRDARPGLVVEGNDIPDTSGKFFDTEKNKLMTAEEVLALVNQVIEVSAAKAAISVDYSAGDAVIVKAPADFHADYVQGDLLYKIAITATFADENAAAASGRSVLTKGVYDEEKITAVYIYDTTLDVWHKVTDTWGPPSGYPLSEGEFAGTTDVYFEVAEGVDEVSFEIKLIDAADGWADVVYGENDFTKTLPQVSRYAFDYEVPDQIIEGKDVVVPVTFATTEAGDVGYEPVRFEFEAAGPGAVTFTATDSENQEHTFTDSGVWGPAEGFSLPADYSAVTDWTLNFAAMGDYTITFRLVDVDTGVVIVEGEQVLTIDRYSTYAFDYDLPDLIFKGEDVSIPVTFAVDEEGSLGYDAVRFIFSATGPGDVTFSATDSAGNENTFTNSGVWGPAEGFALSADYNATTDWTLNFAAMGDYTITFSLIDPSTGNIIDGITDSVDVHVVWTPAEAKAAFLAALAEKVDDITAADVTLDGEDITALFALGADIGAVYTAAEDLLAAFKAELKEAAIEITVGGDAATFNLDDDDVAVEIARHLLGDLTPAEFLASRDAIVAGYTATATDNYGVTFDLSGDLKFQTVFDSDEAKAAFLAALDEKVKAIDVAQVTLDGEDIGVVFGKDAEIDAVYDAVEELLAAFQAELDEARITITLAGGEEATFHLDGDNVVEGIALFLLDGMTPAEFLASRDAIVAGYTATATDNYGVTFDLSGDLKFQTVFDSDEAKAAFLAALDEKVKAIDVAQVTLDGEDITALFATDAGVNDVYAAAEDLLAAFQSELDEAQITITLSGGAAETFYLDGDSVVIAIARFLLGDLNPEQFLAQKAPIIAAYDAAATDNHGAYFELSGELRFLHKYIVSFDVDGGSQVDDQIVNYGEKADVPVEPVKYGYIFGGWFVDENRNNIFDFDTPIMCDTTIYAKWLEADYWSYEIDPVTQMADFSIKVLDTTVATHFELHYAGAEVQRVLVSERIVGVDIAPAEDPANFEIRLFSSAEDEVPIAVASCEGTPGDNYGKLVVHDTWSVRVICGMGSNFSVYTAIPDAAYYELQCGSFDPFDKMPIGVPTNSAGIMFTEPYLLVVRFYESEEASEPLAVGVCSGAEGDKFGKIVYQ